MNDETQETTDETTETTETTETDEVPAPDPPEPDPVPTPSYKMAVAESAAKLEAAIQAVRDAESAAAQCDDALAAAQASIVPLQQEKTSAEAAVAAAKTEASAIRDSHVSMVTNGWPF